MQYFNTSFSGVDILSENRGLILKSFEQYLVAHVVPQFLIRSSLLFYRRLFQFCTSSSHSRHEMYSQVTGIRYHSV